MSNDITESYVSFEVAKLLKEKGFKVLCNQSFNPSINEPQDIVADNYVTMALARPTQAVAVKWLRENFGIHIYSRFISKKYYGFLEGKINLSIPGFYDSLEEATEKALLYTLKNLI